MLAGTLAIPASFGRAEPPNVDSSGSAQPRHVLVTGQAFDQMGGGVKDAEALLVIAATGETLGPVRTDGLGDFQITAEKPLRGKAVVTVRKLHYQDLVAEVELGGPEGAPFVDAAMAGAVVLSGTVTSGLTQKAVAGAVVSAEFVYTTLDTKADDAGAFRLEGLSPGPVRLIIKADGFANQRRELEAAEGAGPQAIVLEPERIVHLRITDEDHQPIAGAGVEMLDEPARDYRHLLTDEQGKAVVRGLRFAAPRLLVRLNHEHYVSSSDFDRVIDLPADVNASTHGLIMRPAGTVIGTVTDAATGKPLYGARLSAGRVLSDDLPRAWSDEEGRYRLVGVTPGKMPVTVHFAGYGPKLLEVSVIAGRETTADFALGPARDINGQVVDGDGKPVVGVHVMATRWQANDTLGLQAMSGTDGRFLLADAPQDAFEIALYARGYKPLLDQPIGTEKHQYQFTMKVADRAAEGIAGSGPAKGAAALPIALTTLDGQTFDLAAARGKVVLVDFWATWCGPCIGEIPSLLAVHAEFGKRDDFVMLSISIEENTAKVRDLTDARKMAWLHATAADRGAAEAVKRYEVSAIPAIYLIDRAGNIAARDLHGDALAGAIRAALAPGE